MDKDIFMFGDGGNSSVASLIPALMQNRGMDPNLVAALMNGNNNRSAWGGDGCWWIWIILLFFCWGGNGWGGNGMNSLPAQLNGDAGRELLMNAIQGNGLGNQSACLVAQLLRSTDPNRDLQSSGLNRQSGRSSRNDGTASNQRHSGRQ